MLTLIRQARCGTCWRPASCWGTYIGGYSHHFWLHEELPAHTHEVSILMPLTPGCDACSGAGIFVDHDGIRPCSWCSLR